jgi:hypothetical protein
VTRDAQAVPQFREGGIGLFADEGAESPDSSPVELGRRSTAVRLGLHGPGGPPSLQEPDEEGKVDREDVGDLAERVFATINSSDDAFPKIHRVRTQGSTSLRAALSYYSIPYVTRVRTALVEALTRAGQIDPARLAEARLLFEQMLGYGNHLGMYAEQTGASGEALGNFPQAFTHLALISAAFNLDRALAGGAD